MALEHAACACAGPPPPRPFSLPRLSALIPPLGVAAAAAAWERGALRARKPHAVESRAARGWESRRERRAAPGEGGAWLTHPSGRAD